METEVVIERDWTASEECKVTIQKGFAYVRYGNNEENAIRTGDEVTLEKGALIMSLQGCTIKVKTLEDRKIGV
jgi:hypothetical protein